MRPSRCDFLAGVTAAASSLLAGCRGGGSAGPEKAGPPGGAEAADVTLRIGPALVDIARDHTISTIGYNGSAPGPVIRLREGAPVTVDLFNDTDWPEFVHWHGQIIPADVDGAAEEKSLAVPARGTYTGQFAFVYIEPKTNPGQYDQEWFLATHEWEPYFTTMQEEEEEEEEKGRSQRPKQKNKNEKPNGWEIGYQRFTINGKRLGYGEPLRVRDGQRVLFHFFNASATENIQLALPGHRFQVTGLDGNPVPRPQLVDALELGASK
jgi:FtsP/CotA-like multicopper oxidase with cupredoxin domain